MPPGQAHLARRPCDVGGEPQGGSAHRAVARSTYSGESSDPSAATLAKAQTAKSGAAARDSTLAAPAPRAEERGQRARSASTSMTTGTALKGTRARSRTTRSCGSRRSQLREARAPLPPRAAARACALRPRENPKRKGAPKPPRFALSFRRTGRAGRVRTVIWFTLC